MFAQKTQIKQYLESDFSLAVCCSRSQGANPEAIRKNFVGGCGICYPICLKRKSKYVRKQFRWNLSQICKQESEKHFP